jgi:CBS domain-containing protein
MICPNCGFDNLPGSEECSQCTQDLTHLDRPTAQDRIERALLEQPVKALLTANRKPPVTVWGSISLREAIQTMIKHNVGTILVVDEKHGKLQGILSERDVVMRAVGLRSQYENLPVNMFMTANPEGVRPTDKLNYAMYKMDGGDYRHLPVLEGDKAIAVISVRDILTYCSQICREHEAR